MAEALRRAGLTGRNATLVVAVSGGPDSMALLHLLLRLRGSLSLKLHVAHIDHDFRGQEAVEDARFVAEQAVALGLPTTIGKEDPVAYKTAHRISSMEEALRRVRYAFLAGVARDTAAAAVALGHTADDQAETVLLHILRGAGLHGLRGMEPLSTLHLPQDGVEVTLARPLLEATREDTRAFCQQEGVPFRDDTTNRSMRFARNR
ncbi:MAG: tRNA lysidine(34) synthetase TilS, partial [Chloroflexota bacterium]|nr:tRNA lysidine(34) synthetase TilS [Chloroflexota bacterium]